MGEVSARAGKDLSPFTVTYQYGICPWPFIDDLSMELWEMYCICDGLRRVQEPSDVDRQSALWVDACRIMASEERKYRKEQEANNGR